MTSGKALDQWLAEYSVSHGHPVNRVIHTVCVPAILFASIALLWNVHLFGLRAAYLAMVLVAPFYLALGWLASIVMAGQLLICVLILSVWPHAIPLTASAAAIFVAAWIGQFVGHAIEGRRPKFLQNMMFLLIGPLWVVLKQG
ncbi:MAG: Mpo1 family 2-hydroxy fatty acid dioxygenase [Steroidobacteraceae bacterium]|jgi:uncharacterized membrane protein YGL010W